MRKQPRSLGRLYLDSYMAIGVKVDGFAFRVYSPFFFKDWVCVDQLI